MAVPYFGGSFFFPSYTFGNMSSVPSLILSTYTIDAADEGIAFIVQAPKTGTISKVGWGTRTVTTGATLSIRIETLDTSATPATPSGTLWGTNTQGSQVVANADDNTWFLTSLTAGASVTKGDALAVVIKNPNTSFGSMVLSGWADSNTAGLNFPYAMLNTGISPAVSWASQNAGIVMALEYADGSYAFMQDVYPIKDTITTLAFDAADSPNVYGLRFKLPFGCSVMGGWVWIDLDRTTTVKLVSSDYNQSTGAGTLASCSLDRAVRASDGPSKFSFIFTSSAILRPFTYYRLIFEPDTGTNLSLYDMNVDTEAIMEATAGGNDFHLTAATSPTGDSSWTNYNSGTFRIPFMGLAIDGIVQQGSDIVGY